MAARRDRRTIAADRLGVERAEMKAYQSGRHHPPVYDDGNGAVCVTFEGETPPEGWDWAQKGSTVHGATLWTAAP